MSHEQMSFTIHAPDGTEIPQAQMPRHAGDEFTLTMKDGSSGSFHILITGSIPPNSLLRHFGIDPEEGLVR